jgi:putative membrane protein
MGGALPKVARRRRQVSGEHVAAGGVGTAHQPMRSAVKTPALLLAVASCTVILAASAQAQSKSEKSFVKDAIAGDLGEIELGKLAQQRGSSEGVKSYGQTLATDHQAALDQMKSIAQSENVDVPSEPKADARRENERLSRMSGQEFDREFVKHMVDDHRKDIREFEAHAKGSDAVAKAAQQQLPVLQKHLDQAQALQKQT